MRFTNQIRYFLSIHLVSGTAILGSVGFSFDEADMVA
jgi:hypothetical protein